MGRTLQRVWGAVLDHCFPGIDRASVTELLWLHEGHRLVKLEALRGAMKPGELARLTSPITAAQRARRELEDGNPRPRTMAARKRSRVVRDAAPAFSDWPVRGDQLEDLADGLIAAGRHAAVRLANLILTRERAKIAYTEGRTTMPSDALIGARTYKKDPTTDRCRATDNTARASGGGDSRVSATGPHLERAGAARCGCSSNARRLGAVS